jgi:hypothetical protein
VSPLRVQRPVNVAYYAKNREREIARVRGRQAETLAFLRDARRVPCADCDRGFAPHQMDFDHRDPSVKSFGVTEGRAMLMARARLLQEISKCDVVCTNCHRIRTWVAHRRRLIGRGPSTATSPGIDARRSRWRSHARLLEALREVPCADCGGRFPPCAMDFDHRDPMTKTTGVTRMVGRAGETRILAEVAKCDIVCANCHRLRTYRRRLGTTSERE